MKVTCDKCGCDMKIISSYGYQCPECKNEIEMTLFQDANNAYWAEHKKNIEWAKVRDTEVIVVE